MTNEAEKRCCENCGNLVCATSLVALHWDDCVASGFTTGANKGVQIKQKQEPCECIFDGYELLSVITVAVKKVTEYTDKPYYMAQSMPLHYCPNCGRDLRGL